MSGTVRIGERVIGAHQPAFIIAEAGVNHNGDVRLAHRLIDAAVSAGADAVKFQTFKAERLVTAKAPKAAYQRRHGPRGSQRAMLRRLELSKEDHQRLHAHCQRKGILFISSPFDEESAEFLATLPVKAYKVPSGELTNIPFLSRLARMGKPLIVSTGMATMSEVRAAVMSIRRAGCQKLILLHCVSAYPANPADVNLRAMAVLAKTFQTPVGFSDHTPGISVSLAAVAMGASVIEKHLTLDQRMQGPDHRASLNPACFLSLVREIRLVESALGNGKKGPVAAEADTRAVARKSLVASRTLAAGERMTIETIVSRRPGTGLPPSWLPKILGRQTRQAIPAETILSLEMFR